MNASARFEINIDPTKTRHVAYIGIYFGHILGMSAYKYLIVVVIKNSTTITCVQHIFDTNVSVMQNNICFFHECCPLDNVYLNRNARGSGLRW